ncbi:MAG: hypothetical protein ACK4OK_04605, partial [Thermoflexus sp.]
MSLIWFLIRRLLITIPVLWLITVLGFALTYLIPADPLAMVLSERAMANPEIVQAYRERWGFDKPPVVRYLTYIRNLLQGDLGESIATQRPVSTSLIGWYIRDSSCRCAAPCNCVSRVCPYWLRRSIRSSKTPRCS